VHLALLGAFPFPYPQGSQVYFGEQACALARAGARVTLLCYGRGRGEPPRDLPLVGAPLSPRKLDSGPSAAKPIADAALAATLARAHRRDPFDAVVAHNAEAALAALLVRPAIGVPVVYVAHTVLGEELATYAAPRWSAPLSALGRAIDRFVARRADAVVALSRAGEAALARHARGPVARIPPALAPEPAPPAAAIEAACERCDLVPGSFALYAGNLDGYQDLPLLAAAAARAKAPFVVATHASGRAPDPLVTVHVRDATEMRLLTFGAGVALLSRSAAGGFPIKLLNYMEAGRAIVARASIADPLVHGASGWLLPDDAPASTWSDAVQSLLVEPALAARLGAMARAVLERDHDPQRIAAETLALVERAMGRRR